VAVRRLGGRRVREPRCYCRADACIIQGHIRRQCSRIGGLHRRRESRIACFDRRLI